MYRVYLEKLPHLVGFRKSGRKLLEFFVFGGGEVVLRQNQLRMGGLTYDL